MDATAIALNRLGLGARPGDVARVGTDPRRWVLSQVGRSPALHPLEAELRSTTELYGIFAAARNAPIGPDGTPQLNPQTAAQIALEGGQAYQLEAVARLNRLAVSEAPFADRWLGFWSNWFTVAGNSARTIGLVGAYEREAIRPKIWGRFEALLLSAELAPGMLVYLDNATSFGPNSQAGRRIGRGLNENLAREILELHTLGVDGGYTQADVTELARALTGWTVAGGRVARFARGVPPGQATFIELLHQPGARTVLGRSYPATGREQAPAILRDLAAHPAVARRVAERLARHFIAEAPPEAAVAALAEAFTRTRGDLAELARVLIARPEVWAAGPSRFKTPDQFLVSSVRALSLTEVNARATRQAYDQLGQQPWRAPSPKGWPETSAEWAGPDALIKRIEWAQAVAERVPATLNPSTLAREVLGGWLSEGTARAIARAESPRQGFVLFLMSPDFQRL